MKAPRMKTTLATALFVAAVGHLTAASSAPLNLSSAPLFLGGGIRPNVLFTLDDSGSMQFEVMPAESFYTEQQFLFPRPSSPYGGSTYTNLVPNFFDNNLHNFFARSANNNAVFYNPNVDYKPWANSDGSLMANANPTKAFYNPKRRDVNADGDENDAGVDYLNLTAQQTQTAAWFGYCGAPNGSNNCTNTGNYSTANINTAYYQWDEDDEYDSGSGNHSGWWPITYYKYNSGPITSRGSYTREQITSSTPSTQLFNYTDPDDGPQTRTRDEEIQNFANWFQYYRSRILAARAGIGRAFAQQGPGMRVGFAAINKGADTIDGAPSPGAMIRGVRPFSDPDRTQFFDLLYGHSIPVAATPLRRAMDNVGKYFERTDNAGPWGNTPGTNDDAAHLQCRQSYQLLMTDGYWNGDPAPTPNAQGNVDNTVGSVINNSPLQPAKTYQYTPAAPYRDSWGNPDPAGGTLADVGMHYWSRDLRPDLPNNVPTNPGDPAFWQHLVNFTIGLGVIGSLDPATDLDELIAGSRTWPKPCPTCGQENIDDLWHTALNSRGGFYSASDPDAFANALTDTLDAINDRDGSAASVALNSGSITSNARLYQARFESGDWSGQLFAYALYDGINETHGCSESDPVGKICPIHVWDAGEVIDTQNWNTGRKVVTVKPSTGAKIPFRWSELDASQRDALNDDPATFAVDNDNLGPKRLNYLRGRKRGRQVEGFRVRSSVLGDIVHSAPVYVGAPAFAYPDDWAGSAPEDAQPYSQFRGTNSNRSPMIYVGANDGMLHALAAGNGRERFAFVPSPVFKNVSRLTAPNYTHRYYVDGSPTTADAFINGGWRTLLAGGLRGGGQGIYALDVTQAAAASDTETALAGKVMWEFKDAQDADLGYTFGEVNIVRMHNGKWAAVFGNGYNSTEADGTPGSGKAVLYIVDLENGVLIKKIDTLAGPAADPKGLNRPNGLATPAPVDIDDDYIVDYIYAGDLFGNMWKFDVTNGSASNWEIDFGTSGSPLPLFRAKAADGTAQPITTRPQIGLHPTGYPNTAGVMVYFGTGQYIEVGDNTATGQITQTFYGIWDKATFTAFTRSHLLRQQIIEELEDRGFEYRITSNNATVWHTAAFLPSGSPPTTHLGWYLDLYNTEGGNTNNFGERQVTNSVLRNGRIIFTTLIPVSAANACEPEGTGWLMELDAASGSRLAFSPFDVDNDGKFTEGDYIEITLADGTKIKVPGSGKRSTVGIPPAPGIIQAPGGTPEYKYTSGSSGQLETTRENPGRGDIGRQTWRQLR